MEILDWIYIISIILILPMLVASIAVSSRVKRVFNSYSGVRIESGLTASDVARKILDSEGLFSVSISRTSGSLTDHYDPRNNTVYLSDSVYSSPSVAAVGVAAHEVGHAIQHNTDYAPAKIRSAIVPVVNFGSKAALPLLLIGFIFSVLAEFFFFFIYIGLACYALSTIFALVTLPVEFNASRRAKKILVENGYISSTERDGVDKVLNAAAMTYVMSFLMSLISLLRMIAIFGRRRK